MSVVLVTCHAAGIFALLPGLALKASYRHFSKFHSGIAPFCILKTVASGNGIKGACC